MLVLTRRPAESIMVGDDVKVTVLGFGGGQQVKLGIEAPSGVVVHRQEVWDRIRAGEGNRQGARATQRGRGGLPNLTREQLEWLADCGAGQPAWYQDGELQERWKEHGEFEAIAELAGEVLALRALVASLERRAS